MDWKIGARGKPGAFVKAGVLFTVAAVLAIVASTQSAPAVTARPLASPDQPPRPSPSVSTVGGPTPTPNGDPLVQWPTVGPMTRANKPVSDNWRAAMNNHDCKAIGGLQTGGDQGDKAEHDRIIAVYLGLGRACAAAEAGHTADWAEAMKQLGKVDQSPASCSGLLAYGILRDLVIAHLSHPDQPLTVGHDSTTQIC